MARFDLISQLQDIQRIRQIQLDAAEIASRNAAARERVAQMAERRASEQLVEVEQAWLGSLDRDGGMSYACQLWSRELSRLDTVYLDAIHQRQTTTAESQALAGEWRLSLAMRDVSARIFRDARDRWVRDTNERDLAEISDRYAYRGRRR